MGQEVDEEDESDSSDSDESSDSDDSEEEKTKKKTKKPKASFMTKMWRMIPGSKSNLAEKARIKAKAEEKAQVMATRFISFNESCLLLLHYMPFKPSRDYGPFASRPNERARPIPGIKWDC